MMRVLSSVLVVSFRNGGVSMLSRVLRHGSMLGSPRIEIWVLETGSSSLCTCPRIPFVILLAGSHEWSGPDISALFLEWYHDPTLRMYLRIRYFQWSLVIFS